jgi:3-oxoacyl-[acyl-carrier-protein] synthase III
MSVTGSRIAALGHYQPAHVVTNDDLATMVETNDEWIRSRVGIAERRIAKDETTADMAVAAAGKALANAGMTAADIDTVVVATCSTAERLPNVACRVAQRLGINAPAAYDINTACSGFSYALATVDHAIRAGATRNALVIGSEKLSDITDWTDRSTCIIFADGAGAAVVTPTTGDEPTGVGPVLWGSDPSDTITISAEHPYIVQDGQAVYRWATTTLVPFAKEICDRAGVAPGDLAAFIPHQANVRIIDLLARKLGVSDDAVVARDIVGSGNTSSASTPMALSKLVERREIASGAPVLVFGFGGGLTYAGQVVRCP